MTMLQLVLFLCASTFINITQPAMAEGVSAKRELSEDYRTLSLKHALEAKATGPRSFIKADISSTDISSTDISSTDISNANSSKTSLEKLDFSLVKENYSELELYELFVNIRDRQFLNDSSHDFFKRRITWLYPDDGCFLRAELMNHLIEKDNLEPLQQVFIFGNLEVKTDNHPNGQVGWWYHVAPITKISDSYYVMDPAINPNEPTELNQWILRQTTDKTDVELSICNSHVTSPFDRSCKNVDLESGQLANPSYSMQFYLSEEWQRQEDLDRDPFSVLDSQPLWNSSDNGPTSLL